MWLAYIVTEGDHRKVSVETSLKRLHPPLSPLTAQAIAPLDLRDDRRGHRLKHLRKAKYWPQIERALHARSIEVYTGPQDVIRCDATTVSGDHEVIEGGLVQFGHSKEDPTRPPIKVMMGSLDPLGMPLATDVLSGEPADDGLSIAVIDRIRVGRSQSSLLFVGDGKMSAWATRPPMAGHQPVSFSPLPFSGTTAEAMEAWIAEGGAKGEAGKLEGMFRTHARGQEGRAAEGYALERPCGAKDRKAHWPEWGGWCDPPGMPTTRERGWKNV